MRGRVERILEEKQRFWEIDRRFGDEGFEARVSSNRPNEEESDERFKSERSDLKGKIWWEERF